MRIVIAGSRGFNDYNLLEKTCINIIKILGSKGYSSSKKDITIICGEAPGADTLARRFAEGHRLKIKSMPAKWDDLEVTPCKIKVTKYGKKYNVLAGHSRNEKMAAFAANDDEVGVLIAFWDGISTGTANMIGQARRYGLSMYIMRYLKLLNKKGGKVNYV